MSSEKLANNCIVDDLSTFNSSHSSAQVRLSASDAYNDGRRQLGLNLLVYALARFDGDAAIHAQRNSIAPEDYNLPLMSVMLEGLAFAALTEAEQAGR